MNIERDQERRTLWRGREGGRRDQERRTLWREGDREGGRRDEEKRTLWREGNREGGRDQERERKKEKRYNKAWKVGDIIARSRQVQLMNERLVRKWQASKVQILMPVEADLRSRDTALMPSPRVARVRLRPLLFHFHPVLLPIHRPPVHPPTGWLPLL